MSRMSFEALLGVGERSKAWEVVDAWTLLLFAPSPCLLMFFECVGVHARLEHLCWNLGIDRAGLIRVIAPPRMKFSIIFCNARYAVNLCPTSPQIAKGSLFQPRSRRDPDLPT